MTLTILLLTAIAILALVGVWQWQNSRYNYKKRLTAEAELAHEQAQQKAEDFLAPQIPFLEDETIQEIADDRGKSIVPVWSDYTEH